MDFSFLDAALTSLPALLLTLAVLALLDSTSFGTLVIPIWLMLAPGRLRPGRIAVYLGTVGGFYFGVGLLLLFVFINLLPVVRDLAEGQAVVWLQLVAGAALLLTGILMGGKRKRDSGPGRLTRWRDRAVSDETSRGSGARALMALALGAAAIEVASMLPYLIGIGLLSGSNLSAPAQVGALAGYCLVMVAPAIVLLLVRMVAWRLIESPLRRFATWMQKNAAETTAWLLAILGFILFREAATALGIFTAIGELIDSVTG